MGCLLGVSRSMQDTVKEECEAEQAERNGERKAGEEEAHSLRCIPYSQSPAPLTMMQSSRKSWRRKKTFIFIPTLPFWEEEGKPTHVDQWAVMVLGLILCLPPHPHLPEVQDVDTELSATHTKTLTLGKAQGSHTSSTQTSHPARATGRARRHPGSAGCPGGGHIPRMAALPCRGVSKIISSRRKRGDYQRAGPARPFCGEFSKKRRSS